MFHGVIIGHEEGAPSSDQIPQSRRSSCRTRLRHVVTFNAEGRRSSRCVDGRGRRRGALQLRRAKRSRKICAAIPASVVSVQDSQRPPGYAVFTATPDTESRPTITSTSLQAISERRQVSVPPPGEKRTDRTYQRRSDRRFGPKMQPGHNDSASPWQLLCADCTFQRCE